MDRRRRESVNVSVHLSRSPNLANIQYVLGADWGREMTIVASSSASQKNPGDFFIPT